jgi:hypothetical protein
MRSRNKAIGVAVLAATLTMFVWGGFSHMVLITGIGYSRLPDEERTVRALESSIAADGLYYFPGTDLRGSANPDERAAWERRFRAGPTGFIVYHPRGGDPFSWSKLGTQLLSHLVAVLLAAFVIVRIQGSRIQRAAVGACFGLFSSASVASIYWNWYGYPTAFFLAQCVDVTVGSALVGLVLGKMLPSVEATR